MTAPPAPASNSKALQYILLGCGGLAFISFVVTGGIALLFWTFKARPSGPRGEDHAWTIRPAEGGMAGEFRSATITVPPGAVDHDVRVALIPRSADAHPAEGARLIGSAWTVQVNGGDHFRFAKPVEVSLPIDPALLTKNVPVSLSQWDGRRWTPVGPAVLEGRRVVGRVDHFSDVAPTQDDAPARSSKSATPDDKSPADLLSTEFWNASVEIEVNGSGSKSTSISSSQFTIARSAALRFRLGTRVPPRNGRVTWFTSFSLKDGIQTQADVEYTVGDVGYYTDDDRDRNGNVYYNWSVRPDRKPQPRASGQLEIDAAAGSWSFSASAVDAGSFIREETSSWQGAPWKKAPTLMHVDGGIHVKLDHQKLSAQGGVIQASVPMTRELLQTTLGPSCGGDNVRGTITVTLSPGPPFLARIRGPYSCRRADVVTLDGTPSLGEVKEYRWTVTVDDDCPVRAGSSVDFTGPTVNFIALWGFTAYLTVTDASGTFSTTSRHFEIRPRRGYGWKTTCQIPDKLSDPITDAMFAEAMQLGVNQCAKHPKEYTSGHMLHTNSKTSTWFPDAYEVTGVRDTGPFNGCWYVLNQKLEVNRAERANKNLMTATEQTRLDRKEPVDKNMIREGDIYALNRRHGNATAVTVLLAQVKAHERAHSTLIQTALDKMTSKEEEPALRIESVVALTSTEATKAADERISKAETVLSDATSEANVKAELEKSAAWRKSLTVWFPTLSGGEMEVPFPRLSQVGETYSYKKPDDAKDK